jgi:hypothetical protein
MFVILMRFGIVCPNTIREFKVEILLVAMSGKAWW